MCPLPFCHKMGHVTTRSKQCKWHKNNTLSKKKEILRQWNAMQNAHCASSNAHGCAKWTERFACQMPERNLEKAEEIAIEQTKEMEKLCQINEIEALFMHHDDEHKNKQRNSFNVAKEVFTSFKVQK